jgi:hypothetical protein
MGASPRSPFYKSAWLWIIIVAIILILIATIIYLAKRIASGPFWVFGSVGVLLLFIGIILLVVWIEKPSKKKAEETTAKELEGKKTS